MKFILTNLLTVLITNPIILTNTDPTPASSQTMITNNDLLVEFNNRYIASPTGADPQFRAFVRGMGDLYVPDMVETFSEYDSIMNGKLQDKPDASQRYTILNDLVSYFDKWAPKYAQLGYDKFFPSDYSIFVSQQDPIGFYGRDMQGNYLTVNHLQGASPKTYFDNAWFFTGSNKANPQTLGDEVKFNFSWLEGYSPLSDSPGPEVWATNFSSSPSDNKDHKFIELPTKEKMQNNAFTFQIYPPKMGQFLARTCEIEVRYSFNKNANLGENDPQRGVTEIDTTGVKQTETVGGVKQWGEMDPINIPVPSNDLGKKFLKLAIKMNFEDGMLKNPWFSRNDGWTPSSLDSENTTGFILNTNPDKSWKNAQFSSTLTWNSNISPTPSPHHGGSGTSFPLWAIIVLSTVGGIVLIGGGYGFYRGRNSWKINKK